MKKTLHPSKNTHTTFFEDLTSKYLPYWPLFLILAGLFSILGAVYLRYATPVYEASATILIKDEKKGSDDNLLSESLNFLNSKKIVENEVVVLQSRNLLDEVVKDLSLYAPVYEKGKVRTVSAYTSSPIIITAQQPEALEGTEDIPFTYDAQKKQVLVQGKAYPLNQMVATPFGTLSFEANPNFKRKAEKELFFSLSHPKKVASYLAKSIAITPAGKTSSIVNLKIKDEVPERGEAILNTLIKHYNNASIDYKNEMAKNTIEFVDERMRVVQRELMAVEKQIQNYKAKRGIVDLSEQGRLYLQNVGDNDQKLAQINMKLAVLSQVENYVSSKNGASGIVPSTLGVEDNVLSGLLDKLYQAELERERLKKTTAENHPVMLQVEDQIERIRPSILENIRSQRAGLLASQRNLSMTNAAYNSVLQTIPQKERELVDVSRQQSIKNGIYSFLLQKREETALAFASNIPDSKIVESARASIAPVSPNRLIIFLVAFVLALISTITYVIYKESFSRNILFRSEIEENTTIPVVAEISHIDEEEGHVLQSHDNPMVGEQFRQLRVAAGLFSRSHMRKKILITSSISGEGKSLVSTNLAINLSLSGKKVVLLDMDMRNPQSSKNFQVNQSIGIADYLEKEVEPYEIIKGTEYENLFVVPAGKTTGNPTELLLNNKLPLLFDYLEEAFDYIVMDSSPVSPLTDAYILSTYTDMTLYVVRHGYTPKTFIKKLDETNEIKPLNNLAIVFNGIKPRGFLKNGFGYGYGYGTEYGYGYGYKAKPKRGIKNMLTNFRSSLRMPLTKKA